jgi:23S rRNA (guanine745-N1)-methyltransferase
MIFCCPKCRAKLSVLPDGRAVCASGHSYDRAKEGYYNLLLKNTGGTHGDNKEMVLARRAFLDSGAYLPLAEKICDAVERYATDGAVILDGGCGEGYYTDLVERRLSQRGVSAEVFGFDISKDAIKYASRKNSALTLTVASSYDVPVSDGSVDVFINVFAPLALPETLRVLKRGARFIMAIPDENHLFGLKSVLYERPYKNTVEDSALAGLKLISEERISYSLTLDTREKISSLFMMTPYAYRTKAKDREKVERLSRLNCTADFRIFVYKKL